MAVGFSLVVLTGVALPLDDPASASLSNGLSWSVLSSGIKKKH